MTDALTNGLIAIAAMIAMAGFGIPIAFSIGIVGAVGLYMTGGATFLFVMVQSLPSSSRQPGGFSHPIQ